ncbi:magnesium-translocating P-type ATPase [Methylacidimicrobium sp. B4]|uniref:magnesium-translocating P-type ATPase n=1 Tax=Methylacidimicrobium sp. B4 TaxID=2796139 RepID=UPI001A905FDA|nr:magnesium-translocating P-type ATPase [Methylacidimicrobium sp. B4]QSR84876.1 magnesium-translocating P-type ATPase [Methylacidimicrobium sp. B4]
MSRAPANPTESLYRRFVGLPLVLWRWILERKKSKERARESALRETEKAIARHLWNLSRLPIPDLLRELGTSEVGLEEEEAEKRLDESGYNEVHSEKPPNWAQMLLWSYLNPFAVLLSVMAVMAGWLGEWYGVFIMSVMIGVSVLLRFFQEFESSRAVEKLKAMVRTTAMVRRRWAESEEGLPAPEMARGREIPLRLIVPGDIIHLSAGDMIPADVRLLSTRDLFVSQAALSGESFPVEKFDSPLAPGGGVERPVDVFGLPNIAFLGTNVISGTATAVALRTGPSSYFGALAKGIRGYRATTSFDQSVSRVSWLLVKVIGTMIPIVLLLNGFTKGNWTEAFLFALAIGVGLTPAMLPMIVTGALAKGAISLSRRKVITKRLNAIQNIGAIDVLCTDKTGTLTHDKIILERFLDVEGEESPEVLEYAYLNSYYQSGLRNLLDAAVLEQREIGMRLISQFQKVDEIPFDFERRRMSVVARRTSSGRDLLITKGAVEEMIRICSQVKKGQEILPLSREMKRHALTLRDELNSDGMRVVAVAYKELPVQAGSMVTAADENELTFCGFIAFLDPPKHDAGPAIEALQKSGVEVKVITGDNEIVTSRICDWVGLEIKGILRGFEIEKLSDEELIAASERTTAFVKMAPLQKARVIRALRAGGHAVGFLGDGINDAPALREADVGISVDTAVDIAKESADVILLEKNLMILEEAVIEGRRMFGNIVKYIKMATSSNFGNVFSVLGSGALLPFLPMKPLQLLIINLIYDLSQTLIPWDRMDDEFVSKPRKWEAESIGRFMAFIGPISSIFDYVTFAVLWFVFQANTPAHQALFQSGWFVESLLSQSLIVHMIRTRKIPFFQSVAAWPLVVATILVFVLGQLILATPFGAAAGLVPLPMNFYFWLWGILLSYCVLTQLVKNWYVRRFGEWL